MVEIRETPHVPFIKPKTDSHQVTGSKHQQHDPQQQRKKKHQDPETPDDKPHIDEYA